MDKADLALEIEASPLQHAFGEEKAISPLRLLQVEDDSNDALLCQIQLEKAGFSIQPEVVTSRAGFLEALSSRTFDIILADYKLPGWSGMEVLNLLKEDGRDIPCILVTGSIGEETAAKCIKRGATDYILKDRPARLPFAISSALEEREERRKRRAAERSRDRLASIVEYSLDAIVGAAADGRILSWNPGAESTFGCTAGDVLGRPFSSLFALNSESHLSASGEPLKTGEGIQRYDAQAAKGNGDMMDLAVTISPIFDYDGTASGFSAIIRDVTDAKRQQRELLTTQKLEAIGQLAGGIAHDFNNLLTVINGYARMLQRKGSGDPAKVGAILEAGERGQRLTKQLLVFSRKQITQFKPVNLSSLVLGFMDMLRPLIGAEVELRTDLTSDLGDVMVDAGQMEQVIMNLVVNARDAMPEGGIIQIATRYLAPIYDANDLGKVMLSVSDTGTGMSAAVQARIFEPFFTTKEVGRGTGLGLSTSCGIVAHCKGKLRVDSQLGQGTTFTIELPACSPASAESQASPVSQNVLAASASGTILLAEDDPTVRQFVVAVLQDQGYVVLAAENGSKALEICENHTGRLHALVTDVVMPEMNGKTLAERVRQLRPDLNVLFVSGYVNKGLKDEDILLPAYAFLEKPFTADALLRALAEFSPGIGIKAER